jgi:TonB family protein
MNETLWFGILLSFALKSALVLGVAWLASLVLRRRSAAARHLVWTAASAAVLALPFLSVSLPALKVQSVATLAPGIAVLFETTATARSGASSNVQSHTRAASVTHSALWRPDWRVALLLVWAIGAAAAFLQMLIAFAALWRVRHWAEPSPDSGLAVPLARDLGIRHPVAVLEIKAGSMPMTCGLLRPAIFMPADSRTWTEERRRIVLLHELAHVERGDVATHLVGRLALILNWWNPLAWFAWREFLKERERAADDLVLATGARASDYAGHLLEVARSMQTSPALAWAAVAMARRSQLEGRLIAILDSHVRRNAAGRASALAAVVAAIALVAPFAAVRAQDPPPPAVPSDIDATFRAATSQNNHEMLEKPAEAFAARREYDNARKLLDGALSIRERTSGAQSVEYGIGLMKIADLEKKRNRPDEAAAFYTKAAQVLGDRPEAAPASMYLGERMLLNKYYQQAIDYLQKAQTLDVAQSGPAQMWMALVREREQNPAAAETLYRSALAVEDPNSAAAATTLELYARFLKDQGLADESKSLADRASAIRKALGTQASSPKSEAFHIGGGVTPPKLLSKVEPEYTEEARTAKYQGTVALSVEIGPDGIARNINVVRGLGLGLDENAITAIQQWHFQPGTKDGAPVPVIATIEVNFRLL